MRWNHLVCRRLPVTGMALFPFVVFDRAQRPQDPVLLRHERIHLRQQRELLVIPFYLLYLGFYLAARLRGRTHLQAYRSIPFEQEAYAHEVDDDYLEKRGFFAWWNFVGRAT